MNVEFISNNKYRFHMMVLRRHALVTQGAFEGSWYHYPPL